MIVTSAAETRINGKLAARAFIILLANKPLHHSMMSASARWRQSKFKSKLETNAAAADDEELDKGVCIVEPIDQPPTTVGPPISNLNPPEFGFGSDTGSEAYVDGVDDDGHWHLQSQT
jgi:hypothetical protein